MIILKAYIPPGGGRLHTLLQAKGMNMTMANEINKQKLNEILDAAQRSGKLGAEGDQLKAALNSGSFDQALSSLKSSDAQKLQKLMNDQAAIQRLISTPQAQQILKKILEK